MTGRPAVRRPSTKGVVGDPQPTQHVPSNKESQWNSFSAMNWFRTGRAGSAGTSLTPGGGPGFPDTGTEFDNRAMRPEEVLEDDIKATYTDGIPEIPVPVFEEQAVTARQR